MLLIDKNIDFILEKCYNSINWIIRELLLWKWLVWFYEKDTTLAFDIRTLTEMKNQGIKSIRYDSSGNGIIKVNGVKAHKYFTYDFKPMLKEIKSWK